MRLRPRVEGERSRATVRECPRRIVARCARSGLRAREPRIEEQTATERDEGGRRDDGELRGVRRRIKRIRVEHRRDAVSPDEPARRQAHILRYDRDGACEPRRRAREERDVAGARESRIAVQRRGCFAERAIDADGGAGPRYRGEERAHAFKGGRGFARLYVGVG